MNKIKYITIAMMTLLILLVLLYLAMYLSKKNELQEITVTPTPTSSEVIISDLDSVDYNVATTPIPQAITASPSAPESLGGDVDIPKDMVEAGNERERLLKSAPVKTDLFTVDFDYKKSRYTVSFTSPENKENNALFEEWKEKEYPSISMDEFTFLD